MRPPHHAAAALAAALLAFVAPWCRAQDANLGRTLAATCANCHGTNGRSQGEVASLAGMPADRLVSTLAGYKSGALTGTIMHQIAKGYTDEQIALIAAYLAAQPPRPQP
jgi:sulfide dehydrogenase cytochrome subunit